MVGVPYYDEEQTLLPTPAGVSETEANVRFARVVKRGDRPDSRCCRGTSVFLRIKKPPRRRACREKGWLSWRLDQGTLRCACPGCERVFGIKSETERYGQTADRHAQRWHPEWWRAHMH